MYVYIYIYIYIVAKVVRTLAGYRRKISKTPKIIVKYEKGTSGWFNKLKIVVLFVRDFHDFGPVARDRPHKTEGYLASDRSEHVQHGVHPLVKVCFGYYMSKLA